MVFVLFGLSHWGWRTALLLANVLSWQPFSSANANELQLLEYF
jgi:hypothetical protein